MVVGVAGALGAVVALVGREGTRDWLARRVLARTDRHHYESVSHEAEPVPVEEATSEAEDLRLSLRARLAESAAAEGLASVAAANADAAQEAATVDRPEDDPVDVARARVRAKARAARARLSEEA
jgi:hypothetical protein